MNEATSGLDNESQARIQNLLETQWKGKSTLIAVVHRLDIIKNFDRIAVMKGGKIAELGTYDELMAKHGVLRETRQTAKSEKETNMAILKGRSKTAGAKHQPDVSLT